ncbi:hypothetical protein NC652_037122 [Populus alba x Populus x berolinensis]|nr:hypothetical protein NC652_037122 [Populus alba x Populus x berolinensis]
MGKAVTKRKNNHLLPPLNHDLLSQDSCLDNACPPTNPGFAILRGHSAEFQHSKASMGLLRSLAMLSLLTLIVWLPGISAQSINSASPLDALLQDYAYRAFVRPRTGITYDGTVPSNLTGIKIAAMRLRSGSLRRKGVTMYKEFGIPKGVMVVPYVERLVLVYQNLGNWSLTYYPLPGYAYLAPVLGLLAYNASNLSATNLRVLNISVYGDPLNITFPDVQSAPVGSVAKCVVFDLQGRPTFSNVSSGNVCFTTQQGHFSIVAESPAPSPAPVSPTPSPPNVGPAPSGRGKKSSKKVGIIVGSVLGGLLLLVFLSFLVLWAQKLKQRKKMQQMERAAEVGESLQMTSVGETKAPAAMVTRTQPTLENEYLEAGSPTPTASGVGTEVPRVVIPTLDRIATVGYMDRSGRPFWWWMRYQLDRFGDRAEVLS